MPTADAPATPDRRAALRAALDRLTPWERNFLVVVNRQGLDVAWPMMDCRSLEDAKAKLDTIRGKLPKAVYSPNDDVLTLKREAVERDAVIAVLTDDVDDLARRVGGIERLIDGSELDALDLPLSAVVAALARIGRGEAQLPIAAAVAAGASA